MPVLKQGSTGSEVTALQTKLEQLGFDPNGVDGTFGPGTTKSVIAFQKSKGLTADGQAGPATKAALQAAASGGSGHLLLPAQGVGRRLLLAARAARRLAPVLQILIWQL